MNWWMRKMICIHVTMLGCSMSNACTYTQVQLSILVHHATWSPKLNWMSCEESTQINAHAIYLAHTCALLKCLMMRRWVAAAAAQMHTRLPFFLVLWRFSHVEFLYIYYPRIVRFERALKKKSKRFYVFIKCATPTKIYMHDAYMNEN